MSRRSSTTAHVSLAKPFQIWHENESTGKHMQGSKRKLRWRFGWSDSEHEHEVDFHHTLTSGKKKVLEDGREITSSSSLFSSDFSHGWNSNGHMFRVEASTALASDPVYIFSIDGVKFENFMDRNEAKKLPKQEEPSKRPSVTSGSKQAPAKRAGSFTADKPVATSAANKVVAQSDSFDPFSASPAAASVDPFAAPPAQADPFAPTPAAAPSDGFSRSSSSVDPFAPAPATNTSAAFPTSAFETSGTSDDPFFSGEATMKKPFAPPAGSQATFAAQASSNTPARRQSAIEIMGDFAGLSADVPPPQPASVMLSEPTHTMDLPGTAATTQKAAPADPWASLVDLDLNKKSPSEHHAQRRASINSGPALSSQLKGEDKSAANNRRGSMPSMASGEFGGNVNPFGPPAVPPQQQGVSMGNGGDPFAAANPQPFQNQQPFGGQPQYGQGMGSGQAVNPFGPGPSGPAQGYGGGMGGAMMGMGYGNMSSGNVGMGGGYGAPVAGGAMGGYQVQNQQPQAKRSSLDSIDPFKM